MTARDTYSRLMDPSVDLDKIEIPPIVISDTSEYVDKSSNLRQLVLNVKPYSGIRRYIIGFARSAYDGSVANKFYHAPSDNLIEIEVFEQYIGCPHEFHIIGEHRLTQALVEHLKLTVRSQRSPDEQAAHMRNICKLVDKTGENAMVTAPLYRDIDFADYPELRGPDNTVSGIMLPKQRSRSGHPANIAFNRFPIIYFNTSDANVSYYGPIRLTIPPSYVFDHRSVLYLVDMHCYGRDDPNCAHYITLCAAKRDTFAHKELIRLGAMQLDIHNNPFLIFDGDMDEIRIATRLRPRHGQHSRRNQVVIEVMVADQGVDTLYASMHQVERIVGNRGPRANVDCPLCYATEELADNIFVEQLGGDSVDA